VHHSLAQIPSLSPEAFAAIAFVGVISVIATVLTVIEKAQKLFGKKPDGDAPGPVTRKEFDEVRERVSGHHDRLAQLTTREELEDFRREFGEQYQRLDSRFRARLHKLTDTVNALVLKNEVASHAIVAEVNKLLDPLREQLLQQSRQLGELYALRAKSTSAPG
jgi:RNA processing factor Prp31